MTYFYAQLFAMDTEIRAMFPAAMDLQRRRFFEALGRIADAREVYISGPDHMIVKTAKVLRERSAPSRLIHYDLNPKAGQGL